MANEKWTNVLLIEDSPTDTRLIQELSRDATRERFHVTAATLAQGLETLAQGDFDVILLDLGLPESHGLDTFRVIREHAPHLPIIVLTISDGEELGRTAVREGAQHSLTKDGLENSESYAGLPRMIRHTIKQKRAEAARKASEGQFRTLFNDSPVAQVRYDADGRPIEANKAAHAFLGINSVADLEHLTIFTSPRVSDRDKAELQAGRPVRYKLSYDFSAIQESKYFPTTHSNVRYADVHTAPLFTAEGRVEGYLAQIVDITDRKHVEEERESIARFPQDNPDPVLRIASTGQLLYANEAAKRLLEALDLRSDVVPIHWMTRVNGAYTRGQTLTDDVVAASGVFQLRVVPVPEEGVNVFGSDVTGRREAEDALWQSRAEVQSLNEELYGAIEELSVANETLERRVQERTTELTSTNQELRSINKRLSTEVRRRLKAEEEAEGYARQQEIINRVIKAGNESHDLRSALGSMLDNAVALLGFDGGAVYLLDTEGDAAELHYASPASPEILQTIPCGSAHVARIYQGEAEFVDASPTGSSPPYHASAAAAHIPLTSKEAVIGHYVVLGTSPHHFSAAEKELLVALGQQAGTVIARMQAEETAKARATYSAVLNEIIHVINDAQDLPTLYESSVITAIQLLGFESGWVAIQTDTGHLDVRYAYNTPPEVVDAVDSPHVAADLHTSAVYRTHELVVLDEAPSDLACYRFGQRGAVVGIPLVSEGAMIGRLALYATERRWFSPEERELFAAIGRELGTAVAKVTAKSRAEQRATMLDGARDAIVMWDVDGQITYWNHGAEQLYGWKRDEAIGKAIHSLLGTTFPEPIKRIRSALTKRGRWEGELTHVTRAGKTVIVESHMTLQHAPDGAPVATLEINNDVTEQREKEAQLRDSSRYARNLIEASLDPLVTISAEGMITDVNKATEDVTGCSRDELIGSDFSNYFTEPEKARAGYKQVFTYGLVRDYPLAIRHSSGRVTDVLYNATVYQNEAGEIQGVFAAARDITDRKRAEEELQRHSGHLEAIVAERTAQLKDAERLAGIGETAAIIGHDLRNPLQGLQYIVDLQKLRFERVPPEKRSAADWKQEEGLFNRISEQVFYMDKIVADLQDFARPIALQREVVGVSTVINDVLASLPHTDHVTIISDVSDLAVMADPHLMHRVFANLVLNAIQAMPEGGTLTISASRFDDSVAISVHDTGVGIPEEMKGKLFMPLSTGKAKGTGLGLAVVKRVVDAHSGTVTFESSEGKGTTFTVTLPNKCG
ncbi:MAG: PAS domain S-box protein [Halobacteriota archaeon]